jgi:hypothetical protein
MLIATDLKDIKPHYKINGMTYRKIIVFIDDYSRKILHFGFLTAKTADLTAVELSLMLGKLP